MKGTPLVFSNRSRVYHSTSIFATEPDSGPQFDPDWSPDGKKIVYRDSRYGINNNDEIYVMNADGSGKINLTHNPANDWSPAWSPDGKKIAFASQRQGILSIYTMNPDGSGVTRLTQEWGEYPSWSPDGKKIAFASARDRNYEIYVMNADGSNQTRLTHNLAEDMYPAWSPDGMHLAFDTLRDHYPSANEDDHHEVHVMSINGSCDRRLTNSLSDARFPTWSPDGARLSWSQDGNVFVMNADGSGQINLGPGNFPAWGS